MSNYILVRADRSTHLKIIAVSLVAGFLVIGVGFFARQPVNPASMRYDDNAVVKAGKPAAWSSRESATIR